MPFLSFIFFDILYLLISFLIFIFIVTIIFYYTALVEMFSIYIYAQQGKCFRGNMGYHLISRH